MTSIIGLSEKFQRLPFKHHLLLALGVLSGIAFVLFEINTWQHSGLEKTKVELQLAKSELSSRDASTRLIVQSKAEQTIEKKVFSELLANANISDEVVREMSRLAAEKGIVLESLKIAPIAETVSELGKVQYNLAIKTDYYLFKGWLAGLLSRYPALGVSVMSIRGVAADSGKQDINLSLVLYLKNTN